MSFTATSGRIRVTDADGVEKLDTNDGLFHIVTTLSQGSVSIPEVATSTSYTNITQTYDLGACHSACTHVIGAVRFSGSGTWGVAFNRWTTYMGGTLVWAMTAPGLTSATKGTIMTFVHTYCGYRFYCSGGRVYMERRVLMPSNPPDVWLKILAHTVTHKLKAGLFT
jgi:hypothetical protein